MLNRIKFNLVFSFICLICLPQIVFANTTLAETISISAQVIPTAQNQGGSGPSGGSSINIPAVVNFSGMSSSLSKVYFLKDGQLFLTTLAFNDGYFSGTISLENTNNYNFSVYGENSLGQKSDVVSFLVYVQRGTIVSVSSINLTFPVIKESGAGYKCSTLIGDLNCDGRVNLTDYTIMKYWYQKNSFPKKIDLNNDKKVDLVDFSIMMYHWTD